MCSKDPRISGLFLSSLDSSHFHGEESQEALEGIQRHLSKHGKPPAYTVLAEDIKISQETRDALKEHTGTPKTTDECSQVIDKLNQYRQTRILYRMAKETIKSLEEKTVDLDAILTTAETSFAEARVNKDVANQFFHTGKDGNADDLVKEIIYGEDNDQWIPTGWKTFDNVNGGMPRGGLVTLGGASGAGKCVAGNTLVTLDIVVFDLETGPVEIQGSQIISVWDLELSLEKTILAREFSLTHHLLLGLKAI